MQTSDQGRAALKLEEGEVLKAYRCPAGIWTIGPGLTAASGVVKPVAGMVITREQSDALLREALSRNYEPAVEMAMTVTEGAVTRPAQHEFDAGVLFDFNTGTIGRASWVKLWKDRAERQVIRLSFTSWSKAAGKLLPGLKARREREFALLMDGTYPGALPISEPNQPWAQWGLKLSGAEIAAVFNGLHKLGYNPGDGAAKPAFSAVVAFQRDHDLTPDGIIGRATLSTLQRALDARSKAVPAVGATGMAAVAAANGLTDQLTSMPHADAATLVATGLWLLSHLWAYRDIIAAKLSPALPRLAAYLRSL
jgi:lysozyme